MNIPGFTADASLNKTKGNYRAATRGGPRGNAAVIGQTGTRADAQHVKDVMGFGEVHCDWFEYCEGRMPNIRCGIRQICYWWPY